MATPVSRVNNFVRGYKNLHIDQVSKCFVLIEMVFGINRVPILHVRRIWSILAFVYCFIVTFIVTGFTYFTDETGIVKMFQYLVFSIFSYTLRKRVEGYYEMLEEFDRGVACRPQLSQSSIRNILQTSIVCLYLIILFIVSRFMDCVSTLLAQLLPVYLLFTLEVHYYGHLLTLLIPRLNLINYYMDSSLSTNDEKPVTPKVEEFAPFKETMKQNSDMGKLMDLYHVIIKSYDVLINAIKWQLLVTLIATFLVNLNFAYEISLSIIRGDKLILNIMSEVLLMIAQMLPMFAPCMFGDSIHAEVRRFRELLASRLYDDKLDKSSRGVARALLALTETRDLSFSLLRMFTIDISLPFKFMGLLITYLIILLQFEKVINPN